MSRPILDERYIHPAIRRRVSGHHQSIVHEVITAIKGNDVMVEALTAAVILGGNSIL